MRQQLLIEAGYPAFDPTRHPAEEVLRRHQRAYLATLPEDVPRSARLVVETACHPDRGARFENAAAMLRAVHWLAEQERCALSHASLRELLRDLFAGELQRAAAQDPRAASALLG